MDEFPIKHDLVSSLVVAAGEFQQKVDQFNLVQVNRQFRRDVLAFGWARGSSSKRRPTSPK
jgi:hypothetical protein